MKTTVELKKDIYIRHTLPAIFLDDGTIFKMPFRKGAAGDKFYIELSEAKNSIRKVISCKKEGK